jgi:hypothetical protein
MLIKSATENYVIYALRVYNLKYKQKKFMFYNRGVVSS